jgi:hypothetical protein
MIKIIHKGIIFNTDGVIITQIIKIILHKITDVILTTIKIKREIIVKDFAYKLVINSLIFNGYKIAYKRSKLKNRVNIDTNESLM